MDVPDATTPATTQTQQGDVSEQDSTDIESRTNQEQDEAETEGLCAECGSYVFAFAVCVVAGVVASGTRQGVTAGFLLVGIRVESLIKLSCAAA
jgi:hypothetical protein